MTAINCLLNSNGKPLSEEVCDKLLRKAREMARDNKKRLKLKGPPCEGIIYTQWKTGSMGTISGVQFTAEVVTDNGETTITFIVRDFDLEAGGGGARLR
jgi:hypothetical protein